jgi:uncharacterized membrane protein
VSERPRQRLDFLDALRGFAVVLMILWHTADSWLADAVRAVAGQETRAYGVLRLLGGTAAPLFLLLAGVAHGLKAAADDRKGTAPRAAMRGNVARGLELIVLGYLLRLQFWAIDAVGVKQPLVLAPLLAGLLLLLFATKRLPASARTAGLAAAGGALLYAVGLFALAQVQPAKVTSVLRVDVLQAIGASLVVLALAEPLLARAPWVALAAALGVTLATEFVATRLPGPLPAPLAAYLARWPVPEGVRAVAMFPLLPWLAFPLVGTVLGRHWSASAARGTLARDLGVIGAVGAVLAVGANETVAYRLGWIGHVPWFVPTLRVLARVGTGMALAALCYAGLAFAARIGLGTSARAEHYAPLRTLGRSSLFVYWAHLELAFGIVAAPLKKRFDLGAWAFGFAALTLAMYALVLVKNGPWRRLVTWAVERVHSRPRSPTSMAA